MNAIPKVKDKLPVYLGLSEAQIMKTAAVFLITGFEESEAVVPIDILRRGGVSVDMVSLADSLAVKSSHDIIIEGDCLLADVISKPYDMLILPGGPGTKLYLRHSAFLSYLKKTYNETENVHLAAICAAPTVYAKLGFLDGIKATVYPLNEQDLTGAVHMIDSVVTDGRFTTGRSVEASFQFGFELLGILRGEYVKKEVMAKMLF